MDKRWWGGLGVEGFDFLCSASFRSAQFHSVPFVCLHFTYPGVSSNFEAPQSPPINYVNKKNHQSICMYVHM